MIKSTKFLTMFLACTILLGGEISIAWAIDYEIRQLAKDSSLMGQPMINERGEIVWTKHESFRYDSGSKLFHFDGATTTIIPTPGTMVYSPRIDDNGQVAYLGRASYASDVFLYLYDGFNNNLIPGAGNRYFEFKENWISFLDPNRSYEGLNLFNIASNNNIYLDVSVYGPALNSNGHLAWLSRPSPYPYPHFGFFDVYYYDGKSTIKIGEEGSDVQINDSDQIVWKGIYGDKLHLLSDGIETIFPVHDGNRLIDWYSLNDNGQIAWVEKSYSYGPTPKYELYFYNGATTSLITMNSPSNPQTVYYVRSLILNNLGHIVWSYSEYDYNTYATVAGGIMVYNGEEIINLYHQNSSTAYFYPDINDRGDIVWLKLDNSTTYEIIYAKASSNKPPFFETSPPHEVFEGEILDFTVYAVDPEGDNIEYSTSALPAGTSFDSISGTLSWLTDNSDAGTYSVTVYATDDGNPVMVSELTVNITVIDVPTPAELIDKIITDLTALNLPQQDMNTYAANLKKVADLIQEGKTEVAINQLNAFIIKLEQDIFHNDAIAPNGQTYIDLANDLISLLENQ